MRRLSWRSDVSTPRDLPVPGRELRGVMFVGDLLAETSNLNDACCKNDEYADYLSNAAVTVISNKTAGWIGVLKRRGARSVTVQNILPKPPSKPDKLLTWPHFPNVLDQSPYYEEGVEQLWGVALKEFVGDGNGKLRGVRNALVAWGKNEDGEWRMSELEGSTFIIECDVAIISMGFVHPNHWVLQDEVGFELDYRANIAAATVGHGAYRTNVEGLFAVGDARRGQSLVVWAIREGRACAKSVCEYLMGHCE